MSGVAPGEEELGDLCCLWASAMGYGPRLSVRGWVVRIRELSTDFEQTLEFVVQVLPSFGHGVGKGAGNGAGCRKLW